METNELTAKEIVDLLLQDKKIKMKFATRREYELFVSNLNVEKSRKRAAHVNFGLDFENKIIKIEPSMIETDKNLEFKEPIVFTFYCTKPTPPRKYSVFQIIEEERTT